ncbi:MAG: PilZ domain-containing protein, partial [Planctomycetota bacterium]
MPASPLTERRAHPRHPLPTTVQFYHGPSQRDFPSRCADISRGGLLMYVPAKTPVKTGDPVRLLLGSV